VGRAMRLWVTGCAVVALAGCAPGASTAGAAPETTARPAPAKPAPGKADCTRATKVAIVAQGSGTSFRPAELTIRRGAFLAVTNKTSAVRPLRSAPDAGIVTSVIDLKERQVIQFPKAGKFTVGTGTATLRLTVAGESGCGTPEPALTITAAGRFRPATADVTATENFVVVNDSGVTQSVRCTPGSSTDHTRLEAGETQILAIDEPGRYVCASLQHPAAKVTVTVTD
jgi:plastocyanin